MRVLNPILILAILTTLAFTAAGQTPRPTPPAEEVIKVSSRLVVVPVTVTDAAGKTVTGLSAEDFRVMEEGRRQEIESVRSADSVPLEIALLFDVSASTDAMFRFEVETAAKFLQDVMRPEDRATIFTIGREPIQVQPRDTAQRSIETLRSITPTKGFTAFYDSVAAAAEYLARNAPEGTRRVVLVVSDGEDTNSDRIASAIQEGYRSIGDRINTIDSKSLYQLTVAKRNEASVRERNRVLKLLQDADTVFYSINPAGSSLKLNKMSMFGQENMQKFATDTGGSAFLPKFLPIDTKDAYQNANNSRANARVLDGIFQQLTSELRSQYLVQYYSESDFPTGRFVNVDVSLPGRPGSQVRAREGYFVK